MEFIYINKVFTDAVVNYITYIDNGVHRIKELMGRYFHRSRQMFTPYPVAKMVN